MVGPPLRCVNGQQHKPAGQAHAPVGVSSPYRLQQAVKARPRPKYQRPVQYLFPHKKSPQWFHIPLWFHQGAILFCFLPWPSFGGGKNGFRLCHPLTGISPPSASLRRARACLRGSLPPLHFSSPPHFSSTTVTPISPSPYMPGRWLFTKLSRRRCCCTAARSTPVPLP